MAHAWTFNRISWSATVVGAGLSRTSPGTPALSCQKEWLVGMVILDGRVMADADRWVDGGERVVLSKWNRRSVLIIYLDPTYSVLDTVLRVGSERRPSVP